MVLKPVDNPTSKPEAEATEQAPLAIVV
jgi:hypothetical protein